MPYYIDQSGRMDEGQTTTVALANGTSVVYLIPSREKRRAVLLLDAHYADRWQPPSRRALYVRLFAAACYYLLLSLPRGDCVIIDKEYTGYEETITGLLVEWLRPHWPEFSADRIGFGHVGRSRAAHKNALAVHQGTARADNILSADDLVRRVIGI